MCRMRAGNAIAASTQACSMSIARNTHNDKRFHRTNINFKTGATGMLNSSSAFEAHLRGGDARNA